MKRLTSLLLLAACASAQAQDDPLASAAWLAGCWTQNGREAGSVEQWMPPAGGLMLGMARGVRQGRAVEFEFLQLRAGDDGRLRYIAQPQGRPPTEFALLSRTAGEQATLVFENRAHNFPQRVSYRRTGADRLLARIEGEISGKPLGVDFEMQRAPCP